MEAIKENYFYSPKFSNRASISIRRLSWYMKMPMTRVINSIIQLLPYMFDKPKVCKSCKDKTLCLYCAFSTPDLPQEEQFKIFESL